MVIAGAVTGDKTLKEIAVYSRYTTANPEKNGGIYLQ
jgi:hypothetical protein